MSNPSAWSKRLPVIALALVGCAIATYLGLYQLDVIPHVWEPFFGNGSHIILKQSSIAHLLPVPDALLGAGAYMAEAILDAIGSRERWHSLPWIVLLVGLMACGLGLTAIALVLCQAFLFHAWCTFCLASAGCSTLIVIGVSEEVRASLRFVWRRGTLRGSPYSV
jgi:hypothetical protein